MKLFNDEAAEVRTKATKIVQMNSDGLPSARDFIAIRRKRQFFARPVSAVEGSLLDPRKRKWHVEHVAGKR